MWLTETYLKQNQNKNRGTEKHVIYKYTPFHIYQKQLIQQYSQAHSIKEHEEKSKTLR